MDKPRMIEHIGHAVDYTVFDVKWIPCSAKFAVLGSKPKGTGVLEIYELNETKVDLVKSIEKKSSFKCGTFGASSLRNRFMAIGDFDGRLQILDLERPEIPIFNTKAHNGIVNAIDGIGGTQINCGAPEIVTGGKDGSVKVWDPRQNDEPVVDISPPESSSSRDCWAVTFGDSHNNSDRVIAAGYDNGDLKLVDLRKLAVRWEKTEKNGVCSIQFDRKDIPMNKMVVTTLEGGLHVYDMRTQHPEKGFASVSEKNAGRSVGSNGVISGPKATVWAVKHLPQNRDIFVTCGGTGSLRLWNYEYPGKRKLKDSDEKEYGVAGSIYLLNSTAISTQPAHCFDWNTDKMGLGVVGAFDQTVRVLVTTKLNLY
ncbi:WDR92 family protein [Megaselia abdita]